MLIGYVRPGRGMSVEEQTAALINAGVDPKRLYRDDLAKDGITNHEFDLAIQALRRGDVLAVTSLDRLAKNRGQLLDLIEGLEAKGVGVLSLLDGLDAREGGAEQVARFARALRRAENTWKVAGKRPEALARYRAAGGKGGRKPILVPTQVRELVKLRDTTTMTWEQVQSHFAAKGIAVSVQTLRRVYALAKSK